MPGNAELFYLKAFLGGLMDRDTLIAHYEQFARDQQARLDELRAIEPTNTRRGHDYFFYFLLRYGIERAEQSVRWAEECARAAPRMKRRPRRPRRFVLICCCSRSRGCLRPAARRPRSPVGPRTCVCS